MSDMAGPWLNLPLMLVSGTNDIKDVKIETNGDPRYVFLIIRPTDSRWVLIVLIYSQSTGTKANGTTSKLLQFIPGQAGCRG